MKDQQRIEVIHGVVSGKVSRHEASILLGRSERQVYRLTRSFQDRGWPGLVHGNRGRECAWKIRDTIRQQVIDLALGKYQDINDTHFTELLRKEISLSVSRETVRTWLRKAGIKPKRRRRKKKYRSRRERKEAFGMMIQIDASDHDWLEGRGPRLTLVAGRDDATNHVWAYFVPSETTWAYLGLIRRIALSHGLPLSLYNDRHTIFISPKEPTLEDQLRGKRPLSQFGRAMEELGISIIPAYSPQAKGRIERLFGILQDRLVVELRLAHVCTPDGANRFLKTFLKRLNRTHGVKPAQSQSVFRKAPRAAMLDPILCLKQRRVVAKDHTLSFEGLTLQIPPSNKYSSLAQQKVEVLQVRDGSILIQHRGKIIASFSAKTVARLATASLKRNSQLRRAA